ncbi:hypothetical protein CF134_00105 [Aeromonas salmonicida]|nr:hypothetical protein CF134_00105 [Aeromonas salmonicida]
MFWFIGSMGQGAMTLERGPVAIDLLFYIEGLYSLLGGSVTECGRWPAIPGPGDAPCCVLSLKDAALLGGLRRWRYGCVLLSGPLS